MQKEMNTEHHDPSNIVTLDGIAADELKIYDGLAKYVCYVFQHLNEYKKIWEDIPGFADLDIDPLIVKNAISAEKGARVCAHIQSGRLYASPETRTAIILAQVVMSGFERDRPDFIDSLAKESEYRKNEADRCQQDNSEEN